MSATIEQLIAQAVRAAVREGLDEFRPSLLATLTDAAAGCQPGVPAGATYVTAREAARIMGAHPVTVRRLVGEGKLGRYSVEGQLRIKVSDIHAYMGREGQRSPTVDLNERALELLGGKRSPEH